MTLCFSLSSPLKCLLQFVYLSAHFLRREKPNWYWIVFNKSFDDHVVKRISKCLITFRLAFFWVLCSFHSILIRLSKVVGKSWRAMDVNRFSNIHLIMSNICCKPKHTKKGIKVRDEKFLFSTLDWDVMYVLLLCIVLQITFSLLIDFYWLLIKFSSHNRMGHKLCELRFHFCCSYGLYKGASDNNKLIHMLMGGDRDIYGIERNTKNCKVNLLKFNTNWCQWIWRGI